MEGRGRKAVEGEILCGRLAKAEPANTRPLGPRSVSGRASGSIIDTATACIYLGRSVDAPFEEPGLSIKSL